MLTGRPSRRALLQSTLLGASALALPRRARASAVSAADRKFVFIFASGGWDATMTFEDVQDNPAVTLESGTERATVGNIRFMDNAARPSVRTFFERFGDRTAIINGVVYPTISHEIGIYLAFSGKRSGLEPDWASILSAAQADRYAAPTLVLSGPSVPGSLGGTVLRCGPSGQLSDLIGGELSGLSDLPAIGMNASARSAVDAYVAARSSARVSSARSARDEGMAAAFDEARRHAAEFRVAGASLDLSSMSTLEEAGPLIASVLGAGISRCVQIGGPPSIFRDWDTHHEHFTQQSVLWEDLFAGLVALNDALEITPGLVGETMADETVIVVCSEFGRMPYLNAFSGKDHWPYTSTLIMGAGVAGDQMIGGFDDAYGGQKVDLRTGLVDDSGDTILSSSVGAAILMLGDVDPGDWVDDSDALTAALA